MSKEHYECLECEKGFPNEEVMNTWRCPICRSYIHVFGEDEDTGVRAVLIRKAAHEIKKGDLVHLPGQLTKNSYFVLGINPKKGGTRLGLGLEGYGAWEVWKDEPINCRTGGW